MPAEIGAAGGSPVLRVHVGFHKTGTSSVQVALSEAASRGALPVLYPRAGRLEHWPHAHHQLVADILRGDLSSLAALREECAAEPRRTVLISAEDFGTAEAIFALDDLARAFPDHALEVVAVVRCHVDWMRSLYMERVKRGVTLLDPMEYFREFKDVRLYAPVLKVARGLGARLRILPYSRDRLEESVFRALAETALPDGQRHRHNSSLSAEVTMAILAANRSGAARGHSADKLIGNAYALEARLDWSTLSREVFSAEEIRSIHRHYAVDRAQVNALAGENLLSDEAPAPLGDPVRADPGSEIALLRRLLLAD